MNRRDFLEQEKKDLEEKISDIPSQMRFLDPASSEYQNLKRRSDIYFSQLEEIETQLSSYQHSSLTKNQRGNRFDKKLPKIDFSKPRNLINKIIEKFASTRKGGSAFFLIENIKETKGELLVYDIRDDLSKDSDDWRHYPINVIANNIVDEQSLLSAIANFIPNYDSETQTVDNPQQEAINIIDKITNGLQVGSLVFFELNDWDALGENQDSLLSWFMEYFWIPLTKKQSQLSQKYANIRIILFLTTSYSCLSEECQYLPHFCPTLKFNKQKIFKLSLPITWTHKDIREWIEDTYKYSIQKSLLESKYIFDYSKGNPEKTCYMLKQKFNKL
ncbi:hypothetical protein BJP34_03205 [Moorena producens PAL-8-15-08-1]|uniref:Inactive STAND domain-containing protein n=1 Tax=Moorena producens PAL-8-15-08-1 TaxID=1458985 RepID=A0A1D8TLQ9_9CYAN|nr:hypothetical protein [Moorena producens]AOW98588.1 hypothetical protein BJP34_03205 [Moorena producens PAL-8-15-08-1]